MCVYSPRSEALVSALAQRASHRVAELRGHVGFWGCIMYSCLVSGAAFYPQASLDTFSMDLFGRKPA